MAKAVQLKDKNGNKVFAAPWMPVGSIYMSVNDINPSIYFGGTWVSWGAGRVPVGVDTSDNDFSTVEKTGGEKEHTLTVNEMPSHSHRMDGQVLELLSASSGIDSSQNGHWIASHTATTSTGGSQPHNNVQPSKIINRWHRTA